MNDDFLQRLRAEPSAKFLAALKARLDRHEVRRAQARRVWFRTAILATLVGGSAVAAFVVWQGVPEAARLAARRSSAQEPSAHTSNIISAPEGGGAPKLSTRAAGDTSAQPSIGPSEAAVPPGTGTNQARTVFSVAGPAAVVLNAQGVARRPVEIGLLKQPMFTVTSSTEAIAMLCHVRTSTGAQPAYVGIAGASRRMLPAELEACRSRGVAHVAELHSGFETVVLARSKLYGAPKLSARDIFLALAAEVPDPNRPQSLIKNPYRIWSAIDGALPEEKIEILGPLPSSATAAAFRQTLLEAGCATFPWLAALEQSDPKRYEKVCRTLRDDGVYSPANAGILEHLETYPNAMALFDYREVAAEPDALAAASVDGIDPSFESISTARYAGSRAMYLYVNKDDVYSVAGMLNFVGWYVQSLGGAGSVTILVAPQRQENAARYFLPQDLKF